MTEQPKRGGARPGTGPKPKPPGETATVKFSIALTPAEAVEYRRRGATKWVRRELTKTETK